MSDFSEARNAIRDLIMELGGENEQEMMQQHQAGMEREAQEKQSRNERSGNAAKGYQESLQTKNEEYRIGSRMANRMNRGLPQVPDPSELGMGDKEFEG